MDRADYPRLYREAKLTADWLSTAHHDYNISITFHPLPS